MPGYILNNNKDDKLLMVRLFDGELNYKDGSKYEGRNPYI